MPIFDVGSPAFQTVTVGGTAIQVWSGTYTPLAALSPAVSVRDVTITNIGTNTCYLGSSSVTASTGVPLKAGQQLTIQNWTATTNTTTNDIYGIASSGSTATTTQAGLATLASVA